MWDEEQAKSFQIVKESLVSAPILAHYNPNLEIEVKCYASGDGLGAILHQTEKDGQKVVQYASRSLHPHENNHSILELKALAIVFALEKFRV